MTAHKNVSNERKKNVARRTTMQTRVRSNKNWKNQYVYSASEEAELRGAHTANIKLLTSVSEKCRKAYQTSSRATLQGAAVQLNGIIPLPLLTYVERFIMEHDTYPGHCPSDIFPSDIPHSDIFPGQFPSPPRTFPPQLLERKFENWH